MVTPATGGATQRTALLDLDSSWTSDFTQFITVLTGMERSSKPTVQPGNVLTVADLPLAAHAKLDAQGQLLGYATIYDVTAVNTAKHGEQRADITKALRQAVASSPFWQVPRQYTDAQGTPWGFAVDQLGNATHKFFFLNKGNGGRWQMLELGIIRDLSEADMLTIAKTWSPQ